MKKKFISRLTTAFEMRGIKSQTDFAKMSKIPQTTISHWFVGRAFPSYRSLVKSADALDLEVDYFMSRD